MRSVVDSPTRIVTRLWAGANAAIVDPGAAVLRRAASASNGAKNGLGRQHLGVGRCGDDAGLAPMVTWLVAVLPLIVVRMVCTCPRTVASSVSSSGFQSGS